MHKLIGLLAALALVLGCVGAGPESEPIGEAQQALVPEPPDQFIEHASIGIHMVEPDGNIFYANPADYEGLGYTKEEWVGHDIREFHVSQQRIEWMLTTLLNGGELVNFPALLWRKNGTVACVNIQSRVDFVHVHTRCFTKEVEWGVCAALWADQN